MTNAPTVLVMLAAGIAAFCAHRSSSPAQAAPGAAIPDTRLHVLMINGGGSAAQNYQSHLLHVRQLLPLLTDSGVRRDRISIFSSDGDDPGKDLAKRETQPEDNFWLLEGTRLERPLRTPITLASSEVPGAHLRPATKAALSAWFSDAAKRLRRGDTLLLYVTDHGTQNKKDPKDNFIVLWGKDETLSVRQLQAMLETLHPGVRVVTLMSQCYSGSFAHLYATRAREGRPTGSVCGYFSSTADRQAYGCYPENRDRDNVGHSFEFMRALASSGRLAEAHSQILATDDTPDVPLRTTDVYGEELLQAAASKSGQDLPALVDELLREAWKDRAAWAAEIRLLDRIGAAFGCFSPRSLAELEDQARRLPDISTQLKTHSKAWKTAAGDATQANLDRFLAGRPEWAARTSDAKLAGLDQAKARPLAAELLAELGPFTRAAAGSGARLETLRDRTTASAAASYRMEVRLGVMLRMRAVLMDVAVRVHIATRATPAERTAYEALWKCEQLDLPGKPSVAAAPVAREPFPPFEEDVRRAQAVLPAWMGITFKDAPAERRAKLKIADGASAVTAVYPDSPAAAAGLEVGDIVTGPPGAPFTEHNQIRVWTMLSRIGEPHPLEVMRGDALKRITLVPKPFPVTWPALPGPPKVGSVAPPWSNGVKGIRGTPVIRLKGIPYILFFWATWCGPCKASLLELMAFAKDRKTPIIAITDEPAETLDPFFKKLAQPFPETVVSDELRRSFLGYGVSGTPTFVLVDGGGIIRSYTTGYATATGLGIEGWKWKATGSPASAPP